MQVHFSSCVEVTSSPILVKDLEQIEVGLTLCDGTNADATPKARKTTTAESFIGLGGDATGF